MKVIDSDQECSDIGGKDIFSLTWPGTRDIYYRGRHFYSKKCNERLHIDDRCSRQHMKTAIDAKEMTIFRDRRICGIYMDGNRYQNGSGFLGSI